MLQRSQGKCLCEGSSLGSAGGIAALAVNILLVAAVCVQWAAGVAQLQRAKAAIHLHLQGLQWEVSSTQWCNLVFAARVFLLTSQELTALTFPFPGCRFGGLGFFLPLYFVAGFG